jgi:hypothetical protein
MLSIRQAEGDVKVKVIGAGLLRRCGLTLPSARSRMLNRHISMLYKYDAFGEALRIERIDQ